MAERLSHTWDGLPISPTPPYGAMIVVFRSLAIQLEPPEVLLLHRGHKGPDFEGPWAWGPPSGARLPGEDIAECAQRELHEETGLRLPLRRVDTGSGKWFSYLAQAPLEATIRLSAEHDRYVWLPVSQARQHIAPQVVLDSFDAAVHYIVHSALSDHSQNQ